MQDKKGEPRTRRKVQKTGVNSEIGGDNETYQLQEVRKGPGGRNPSRRSLFPYTSLRLLGHSLPLQPPSPFRYTLLGLLSPPPQPRTLVFLHLAGPAEPPLLFPNT